MQDKQMLNTWDALLQGGRTEGMLEKKDKGKEGCRRGRMRDMIDAG